MTRAIRVAMVLATLGCTEVPPELSPLQEQIAEPGVELTVALRARDPDGDPVEFTLQPRPHGAILERTSHTTALLRWTPAIPDLGEHVLTVAASDGASTVRASLRITVRLPGDDSPPAFVAPSGAGTTFHPRWQRCLSFPVVVNDPDSAAVAVFLDHPSPDDAHLEPDGPFRHRLVWCPASGTLAPGDLRTFVFAAYDGGHPAQIKTYFVLVGPTG